MPLIRAVLERAEALADAPRRVQQPVPLIRAVLERAEALADALR